MTCDVLLRSKTHQKRTSKLPNLVFQRLKSLPVSADVQNCVGVRVF